jgi:hypothetical protein
MLIKNDMLSM